MRTKVLFIATIALLLVVEISMARPEGRGRLLGRRGQMTTADNSTVTQPAPVPTGEQQAGAQQPQQQPQQAAVQNQPATTTIMVPQEMTTGRGRRARTTVTYVPTTQVMPQQTAQVVPQDQQPVAQAQPQQPAAQVQPQQQQPIAQTTDMVPQESVIGRGRRARTVTNYVPAAQVQANQPANTTRQAFYPANTSAPVVIDMRIPANAEVWFGDAKTNQTGAFRQFISPNLEPQKNYVYEVKAKWMQNGQPIEQTRQVNVVAGNRIVVDFNTPAAQ